MDPVPYPKGAATRIEASVRALLGTGNRVLLVTPACPSVEGFSPKLEIEGLKHRVFRLEEDNFLDRALAFRQRLEVLCAQRRPRVAVVRSIWEGLGVLRALPETPVI